jgi:hypothetical protein
MHRPLSSRPIPNLALLQFQLKPKKGVLISDLRPDEIQILEDGVPQRTPVEITFLRHRLHRHLRLQRLRPAASRRTTREEAALTRAMQTVWDFPTGDGPLFSAIRDTARQIAPKGDAGVRRMLVVVSSGILGDIDHAAESAAVARDHGVVVYPVRLQLSPICLRTPESRLSVQVFDSLVPQTGGRNFPDGTGRHKAQIVLASKDRGQIIGGTRVVLH